MRPFSEECDDFYNFSDHFEKASGSEYLSWMEELVVFDVKRGFEKLGSKYIYNS